MSTSVNITFSSRSRQKSKSYCYHETVVAGDLKIVLWPLPGEFRPCLQAVRVTTLARGLLWHSRIFSDVFTRHVARVT